MSPESRTTPQALRLLQPPTGCVHADPRHGDMLGFSWLIFAGPGKVASMRSSPGCSAACTALRRAGLPCESCRS